MADISERLAEIRERGEAATDQSWKYQFFPRKKDGPNYEIGRGKVRCYAFDEENADFIAHARSDVPYLLELLERIGEGLAALHEHGPLSESDYWLIEDEETADVLAELRGMGFKRMTDAE